MKPLITIIEHPNINKSTLFNQLINKQKTLVLNTPKITQNQNYNTTN